MSGLLSALTYSTEALTAQSVGLQVTGRNVANASVASYSREQVTMSDLGTVGTGSTAASLGVAATGVRSVRDQYLDAQVASENSVTSMLQAQSDSLTRAEAGLGESINLAADPGAISDTTASATGISGTLSGFFNAFQALSADPTNATQKQVLMQSAGSLTAAVNSADANLAAEQQGDTQRVAGDVSAANGLLTNIASLNKQIGIAEAGVPGSALSLRDQRQADIESLTQTMNVTVSASTDYPDQIQISARDGQGNAVPLLDGGAVVAPLSFDGTNVTAGTGAQAATLNVTGGSIAGELQASNGTIAGLRGSLATMAGEISSAVNSAYNPGGTHANFFAASPAGGQLLQVDPATTAATLRTGSSGDAGANDLALAVANVGTENFSTATGDAITGTLSGYYSGVVANFGAQIAGTNSQLTNQTLVSQQISSQRDAVSGVSVDEETANLMQYQQAYQASSHVISVINSMFDSLMSMMTASG